MTDSDSRSSPVADAWDTYWHGTGDVGAYASGGVSHPSILAFWDDFFESVQKDFTAPKIVDVASGNGAVVERALAAFGNEPPDVTCIDVSDAAIANVTGRFAGVRGIVADACAIPLDSAGFDVATSQFGVEYAGVAAIAEAARLVAPGGRLALLLHSRTGSVHRECKQNLDAIVRVQESGFIPCSIRMFSAGFEACRGADRTPYDDAATELAPAVQALESIMAQYGENVAGDTVARLYSDVGRIHSHIQRYEPAEVLGWLSRMEGELDAYAGRMSSMCEAAIDNETFDRICEELRGRGYTARRAEPLAVPDHELPLAWVLVASR